MAKVCILVTAFPWNEMRLFYRQAPALAKAGHDVLYVCSRPDPDRIPHPGLQFVPISARKARLARWTGAMNLFGLITKMRPDMLELTCIEQVPLGLIVALTTGIRVVYDCREDHVNAFKEHKDYLPRWARYLAAGVVSLLERIGDRVFDGLVASDSNIGDMLHNKMPVARKVVYLNTPLLSMFTRQYSPLAERRYDLAMMGSMTLRTGIDTLIHALGILKQRGIRLSLCLIGKELASPTREHCDRLVEQYGLADQITTTGWVDHGEIPAMLADVKIGISPHKDYAKFRNNIACKVFEYMAAGMPVVCSDIPPQHMFVTEGVHGYFFTPDDAEALAGKLRQLVENPALAQQMGDRGRAAIEARWNCERENEKLASFYAQILALGKR